MNNIIWGVGGVVFINLLFFIKVIMDNKKLIAKNNENNEKLKDLSISSEKEKDDITKSANKMIMDKDEEIKNLKIGDFVFLFFFVIIIIMGEFGIIVGKLTSPNNEERRKAEEIYNSRKANQPMIVLAELAKIQISHPDVKVRTMSAVSPSTN